MLLLQPERWILILFFCLVLSSRCQIDKPGILERTQSPVILLAGVAIGILKIRRMAALERATPQSAVGYFS